MTVNHHHRCHHHHHHHHYNGPQSPGPLPAASMGCQCWNSFANTGRTPRIKTTPPQRILSSPVNGSMRTILLALSIVSSPTQPTISESLPSTGSVGVILFR